MTTCAALRTTQPGDHHWICARLEGHRIGHHRFVKAEPAPDDEPHPNTDWQELTP